ncbi:hypothetical protein NC651_011320 [Populus alba x Populus x berolinensis]|nr:hypothetical protein NC651_011320 [Populus alba x Populus x berolinensis]
MVNINVHKRKITRCTVLIQGRSATSFEPSTRLFNLTTGPEAIEYGTMLVTHSRCSYAVLRHGRHWKARQLCPLVVAFLCTSSTNLLPDRIDFVRQMLHCWPGFRLANRVLEDPCIYCRVRQTSSP